jgi:hypothetical protein
MSLPFVGARAMCPDNKINIKSIFLSPYRRKILGKLLSICVEEFAQNFSAI